MTGSDSAQHLPSYRMSGKHRTIELERLNYGRDIVSQAIRRIVCGFGRRSARCPKAAWGDPKDVIVRRQLDREAVEYMGCIPEAGKKDQGLSAASPIEDF